MLNDIIISNLLPQWAYLLDEAEPVPLFALKLLSVITNRSWIYTELCDKLEIFPLVLSYY